VVVSSLTIPFVFLSDSTLLEEERIPNVAFFSILLQKIVRRRSQNAFRKENFFGLAEIPVPLHAKPSNSIIGNLCETSGITEDWLFKCEENYTGQGMFTLGMVLEPIAVRKSKCVTDVQCARWVQRLFSLESVPHSGTIRLQWERISARASKLQAKKKERDNYLQNPYLPHSSAKLEQSSVSGSAKEKENMKLNETVKSTVGGSSNDSASKYTV
jgi:hypothetical protein